ncbi:hypothetical protein GDO81_021983 [Engystomops pustulosus]|uniref:Uncharacterized protein n=1 Tax=Engystomops pustulosus TaxID=76066 RepID=A0AAV6YSS0_ENGPU|nr:hypothetical protein GDO81_021983 [Engystomops pustulosus]
MSDHVNLHFSISSTYLNNLLSTYIMPIFCLPTSFCLQCTWLNSNSQLIINAYYCNTTKLVPTDTANANTSIY